MFIRRNFIYFQHTEKIYHLPPTPPTICRHMKIHDKDSSLSSSTSPPPSGKRKRPSAGISKKKPSHSDDGEQADEPSSKKVRFVAVICGVIFATFESASTC